jgi:DNA ligase (NAD+)
MDLIREMTVDELMLIDGIGEETAKSIFTYFRENWDSIEKLLKHLRFAKQDGNVTVPQTLRGRNFSITGSFEGMSRDDVKAFIEARGGNLLPSVSKKSEFLLVGKEPSGAKMEKAVKLGLHFLDFVPEVIENF